MSSVSLEVLKTINRYNSKYITGGIKNDDQAHKWETGTFHSSFPKNKIYFYSLIDQAFFNGYFFLL